MTSATEQKLVNPRCGSAWLFALQATQNITRKVRPKAFLKYILFLETYTFPDRSPYREGVLLSTDLWVRLVNYSVVVQVVFDPQTVSKKKITQYTTKLQELGANTVMVSSGNLDCPLEAQIQRLCLIWK